MTARNHTILLATGNRGKVVEFAELLAPLGFTVEGLALHPEVVLPEETGTTHEENARLKAVTAARAAGMVALADDSGLSVDALGGAPGIRSARFGGPGKSDAERCAFLLQKLAGVPAERRTGHFVCVIAVASPQGEVRCVRGETYGRILEERRGNGGFGYDPLFLVPEEGRTYAELAGTVKDSISHRGRAASQLQGLFFGWPELWEDSARESEERR